MRHGLACRLVTAHCLLADGDAGARDKDALRSVCGARPSSASATEASLVTSQKQKFAPIKVANASPELPVHVEDRNLAPCLGKRGRGGSAQAGGAARHDGCDVASEFHLWLSSAMKLKPVP